MTNGNSTKFYFRVEDLKALVNQEATHIVINAETGEAGAYSNITAMALDAEANSKGSKGGCPWPCGGSVTDITPQSLEQARQVVSDSSSK